MINGKQFAVWDPVDQTYAVMGYSREGSYMPGPSGSERPIALYGKVGPAKALRTGLMKRQGKTNLEVHEVEVVRRAVL